MFLKNVAIYEVMYVVTSAIWMVSPRSSQSHVNSIWYLNYMLSYMACPICPRPHEYEKCCNIWSDVCSVVSNLGGITKVKSRSRQFF